MDKLTGFSDVDGSNQGGAAAEYLNRSAVELAERRRQGYGRLGLTAGMALLDVGCGLGEVCTELVDSVGPAGRVAGIDLSDEMIQRAKSRPGAERVEFTVASVYDLPYGTPLA